MTSPLNEVQQIIDRLGLTPLCPEGGWFARTWTSTALRSDGRAAMSAIVYLITPGEFSALHRLDADELWLFHAGDPVEHLQLTPGGPCRLATLGADILAGQVPQVLVTQGVWQGACPVRSAAAAGKARGWSLLGCTMTPGWSEGGFELGDRDALRPGFPSWGPLIEQLTRPSPSATPGSSAL